MNNVPPPPAGMPILSGPPPLVESSGCRKCGRDFNALWRRSKSCGHCGYEYCGSCVTGEALMPRAVNGAAASSSSSSRRARRNSTSTTATSTSASTVGSGLAELRDALLGAPPQPGYDVEKVCAQCDAFLKVTAAPVERLRTLPLKELKAYVVAYDIKAVGVAEKEDMVQAVLGARSPANGCLRPEHESYYRRKSVPRHGQPQPQPQPQQQQRQRQQQQQQQAPPYVPHQRPAPRPNPFANPHAGRPPPPHYSQRPPPPASHTRPPPPAQARPPLRAPQTRPPAQSQARPAPPPPVPTILSLVPLPKSYLSSLSIGTLKAILFDNHVRVDFKHVLEKADLIERLHALIEEERRRLERARMAEEREAAEADAEAARARGENVAVDPELAASPPRASPPAPAAAPTGPAPDMDRGLCVVCQDEEATLAVVDCGHLAMCQPCSDLIMATSKECPLCRTRIVTPQRLIRIFRV